MNEPTWKTCRKHGNADENAWGCPECVRELRQLLRDANRGAEVNMHLAKSLTAKLATLRLAAETYMAAVACYNENPWDRVNVRKYTDAKQRLRDLLPPQPNTRNQPDKPR